MDCDGDAIVVVAPCESERLVLRRRPRGGHDGQMRRACWQHSSVQKKKKAQDIIIMRENPMEETTTRSFDGPVVSIKTLWTLAIDSPLPPWLLHLVSR